MKRLFPSLFKTAFIFLPLLLVAISRADTKVVLPDAERFAANLKEFLVTTTIPGDFKTPEGIVWALLVLGEQAKNPKLSAPFSPKTATSGTKEPLSLAAYFRGANLKGTTITLAFVGDAMRYLNASIARQQAIKGSIEATLKENFPFVTTVEYQVDGKIVTDWDA